MALAMVASVGCPDIRGFFMATIELRNDSGVDLTVTPVGTAEGGRSFRPLPRYELSGADISVSRHPTRIFIAAGTSISYTYDTDDYNFRLLVVRPEKGQPRVLLTDFKDALAQQCCYGPQQEVYAVPELRTLPAVPPDLLAVESGKLVRPEVAASLYPKP